jgi:hypothetical protein
MNEPIPRGNTDRSSRLEGGDVLDRVAVKRLVLLLGDETQMGAEQDVW